MGTPRGQPLEPRPLGAPPSSLPGHCISRWNAGQSTSSSEINLQIHIQIHQHCMGFHGNEVVHVGYYVRAAFL